MKLDFGEETARVEAEPGEGIKVDTAPSAYPVKKFFDLASGRVAIVRYEKEIGKLYNTVDAFEVKSNEDMVTITEMIGQAKELSGLIEKAAKAVYDPYYQFYKKLLNLKTSVIEPLKRIPGIGNKKTQQFAYQVEMDRRAAQAEADKKAREFQAKLDAEAKAVQDKLDAEAKKNKKKAPAPIKAPVIPVYNMPQVVPEALEAVKTESGSLAISMVWDAEIENMNDPGLLSWVLRLAPGEYKKAIDKVLKVALRDGVREGIPGIKFFERAETKHRKR
jgi:hypothetical protein